MKIGCLACERNPRLPPPGLFSGLTAFLEHVQERHRQAGSAYRLNPTSVRLWRCAPEDVALLYGDGSDATPVPIFHLERVR